MDGMPRYPVFKFSSQGVFNLNPSLVCRKGASGTRNRAISFCREMPFGDRRYATPFVIQVEKYQDGNFSGAHNSCVRASGFVCDATVFRVHLWPMKM